MRWHWAQERNLAPDLPQWKQTWVEPPPFFLPFLLLALVGARSFAPASGFW